VETLGPAELLVVLAIILLVFGSSRLPRIARSLGDAAHELRRGTRDDDRADGTVSGAGALEDPGAEDREFVPH
jgi:sec-independent protein translocase protein TatA